MTQTPLVRLNAEPRSKDEKHGRYRVIFQTAAPHAAVRRKVQPAAGVRRAKFKLLAKPCPAHEGLVGFGFVERPATPSP